MESNAPICEHAFCRECIAPWLTRNCSCPLCREPLTMADLKPVSRIMRSFLSRLNLTCNFQTLGCSAILTLEQLNTHSKECKFNPKRLVTCDSGCGIAIHFQELENHNCVQRLRTDIESKISFLESKMSFCQKKNGDEIYKLESKLSKLEAETAALKSENVALKKASLEMQLNVLPLKYDASRKGAQFAHFKLKKEIEEQLKKLQNDSHH
ncbi:E3 ubiquitin-protein ligase NRDP1-like isoform X2 [Artemia franciscana]|uniref:E3 ubiquitin-protein ligase NRDP1-like isoform X2 n=1 Tax=Artemia franciscana TaxID=6661 RepID=UPI0032DB9F6D